MLVEHARTFGGIADAIHGEYTQLSGTSVVTLLDCSLNGMTIEVDITAGSRLAAIHGDAARITEDTTCNYGLNPSLSEIASASGMLVSGVDETGEVRAVELSDHPFFVGTLYQPQLRSAPGAPHPIFSAFVTAVVATSA